MGRLFGTDGIRGVIGEDLTPALARLVGRALVRTLPKKDNGRPYILIGMDTRLSSHMLADSVIEGICECGGDAVNIDVCATPAIAYLVLNHHFDAGVMISASHNPWQYNGIKIFGSDGFKLDDNLEEEIEAIILDSNDDFTASGERGSLKHLNNAIDEYADYLISSCDTRLDGMKIGIDCANGSSYVTAERIFSSLGAECFVLADDPDGMNINKDCGSTHLEGLKALVVEKGLDLGVAFDGDADRCLAIDENGREIDGDYILAILGSAMKEKGTLKIDTIVGTVMSNLGLINFCKSSNIGFLSTKVGDRYVLEALNERGLSLGGEQSGHIILRELSTTGDGQLTALALLCQVKKSGKSLATLADVMKKCPQYMVNVHADAADKEAFKTDGVIKEMIAESEKEMGERGRILIRPSGTEHLIRVMTEGEDPEMAEKICHHLAKAIEARLAELK